ncbi:MAG: metallophosphatase domain-containing protein [Bacteroidota bacterium]
MRCVAISDTHGQHSSLQLPPGDLLIHAGDVAKAGGVNEIKDFLYWFAEQPHTHKVFIAGNHDFYFERAPESEITTLIPDTIHYLNDSSTLIEGIKIHGSPVQPWFLDWAFNRQRGADIDRHWQLIPEDTDILLTHGPPKNILDTTFRMQSVGCEMLAAKIEAIRPKYNIFGHIHEAYGQLEQNGTTFINASVLNLRYQLVNAPVVFDFVG